MTYQASAKNIQGQKDVYTNLAEATIFIQNTTPFDEIIQNLVQVKKMEKPFKEQIKFLLEDSLYEGHIDDEIRDFKLLCLLTAKAYRRLIYRGSLYNERISCFKIEMFSV